MGPFDPYWRVSNSLPYQVRLTTPKMAEEGNLEIPHGLATATSGFQDRPLAFRVTLPSWRKGGVLKPYTGFPPLLAVFEAASLPLGLPFQIGGTGEIRTHTVLPLKQVTLPVGLQFR